VVKGRIDAQDDGLDQPMLISHHSSNQCNETVSMYHKHSSCHSLLFTGHAAGGHFNGAGSGSNFLCLHEDPQWKTYIDGDQVNGLIVGVEYELGYIT